MSGDQSPTRSADPGALRVRLVTPVEGLDPIIVGSDATPAGTVGPRLQRRGATHVILVEGEARERLRTAVTLLPPQPVAGGTFHREVIVDGWRIVVELESDRRAALRERAQQGRDRTARGGHWELRAVIPGRIVAVAVVPGDRVTAGQQVMAVEAMKMQNELRAPRDGVVASVAVGPGQTVEVGDLLLVLE